MGLNILQAPSCDPIRLVEAKAYLRVTEDHDDELITRLIPTVTQAIEGYTGRSLIKQNWRFTINAGYCASLSDSRYISGEASRGVKGIELPRSPFIALSQTPKLVDGYGERDIRDYRLDTAGRIAKLHFGQYLSTTVNSQAKIQIDFSAGFGEEPEDVPEPIRQAILIMMADLYDNRLGGVNDNAGLPVVLNDTVLQLVKPYRVMRL